MSPTQRNCKECGKEYIGVGNSRYCCSSCRNKNRYEAQMFDPEFRVNRLMSMAKNRARNKGLDFNLDLDYLMGIWDGTCSVSGIELCLGKSDLGLVHPYAPSLDKINPKLGYVRGNVRWVCYQINVAMSEFGLEQFEELVSLFVKNNSLV